MRFTILSSVACPVLNNLPIYLINGTIFGVEKVTELKMFVLIFSTILSETFLILRRTERDILVSMQSTSYCCQIVL